MRCRENVDRDRVADQVAVLATVIYGAFTLLDLYGVSLAALGMLATLACCLTIDVYGPVCFLAQKNAASWLLLALPWLSLCGTL